MSLADVYLVSPHCQLLSEEELDQFESKLGFPLPKGYREYMTVLGKGEFCHGLTVRTPEQILKPDEITWWREGMVPAALDGMWEGRMLLSPEELKESLVFAHTNEGDYFASCPLRPGELFEFPRHENKMYHYPEGFLDPFAFEFCKVSKFNLPFFEPDAGNREFDFYFKLAEGADVQEVWNHVSKIGSQPLRVAEGEIGKTDRVVAFIPDISGCAWMDDPSSIYFFCTKDHASRLQKLRQDLAHLEKAGK